MIGADRSNMAIADKVWELRTARGWPQVRLSKEAGISNATLNALELGKRAPTLGTLRRLAKALDVPVTELLEGKKT